MASSSFDDLSLVQPLRRALDEEGYLHPTPIQQQAIPPVLAGRDLLATAQTGTGKTAAFALPLMQRLSASESAAGRAIRVLVLTPTRELALQIDTSFKTYGKHLGVRTAVVLGGVPAASQIKALRARPDILVATPGRLLDLHRQGHVRLEKVEALVLDEADRMLDMGFVQDVRRIVGLVPTRRQTLLFSATIPPEVATLAADMLTDPVTVSVTPSASVSGNIDQRVLFVTQSDKRALLTDILQDRAVERALVFTRTKHRANRISKQLASDGISADAIHSNKSQGARQRALAAFDRGSVRVLVATDIMARGIDVEGISHVINFELPNDPESYVHRIGRTARAGASGIALSFCDGEELPMLHGIERLTRSRLAAFENHRYHAAAIALQRGAGHTMNAAKTGPRKPDGGQRGPRSRQNPQERSQAGGHQQRRRETDRGGVKSARPGTVQALPPRTSQHAAGAAPRRASRPVHLPSFSGGPTSQSSAKAQVEQGRPGATGGGRVDQQEAAFGRRRRSATR